MQTNLLVKHVVSTITHLVIFCRGRKVTVMKVYFDDDDVDDDERNRIKRKAGQEESEDKKRRNRRATLWNSSCPHAEHSTNRFGLTSFTFEVAYHPGYPVLLVPWDPYRLDRQHRR